MFNNSHDPISMRVRNLKQAVGNSNTEKVREAFQLGGIQSQAEMNNETLLAWDAGWYQFNQHTNEYAVKKSQL